VITVGGYMDETFGLNDRDEKYLKMLVGNPE
jgi:hypothetical protein